VRWLEIQGESEVSSPESVGVDGDGGACAALDDSRLWCASPRSTAIFREAKDSRRVLDEL